MILKPLYIMRKMEWLVKEDQTCLKIDLLDTYISKVVLIHFSFWSVETMIKR